MAIEPVIFFSYCFMKKELCYGSLELEVVCFVWVYKRLYILLYSNNYRIVVLTDHEVIRGIVYHSILNTIFIDCVNRRFINVSVYLSAYLLEMHYIPGWFNYILDVLLCLYAISDDIVYKNIAEPVLDAF